MLVVALGDVSGKGVPAALYSAAIGEMVRGRTFRRRLEKQSSTPAGDTRGHEPHPPRTQPRGVLLHALLCDVRVQEADRDIREFRIAVPDKCSNGKATQIDMPGVPLGSFGESQYEDFQVPLAAGDVFVLCSDGISEAFDEQGRNSARRA